MGKAKNNLPSEYEPLSAWAYVGYNILYSIPVIGWIFMIIYALDDSNINRRNYTRSFFVVFLIVAIFILVLTLTGTLAVLVKNWADMQN